MTVGSGRVLITGANGFVGRALCRHLGGRGYFVVAAVRDAEKLRGGPGIEVKQLELMEGGPAWLAAMQAAECVVHLAAHVHQKSSTEEDSERFHEINTLGSRLVAEMAAEARVRRFILMSSIKATGDGGPRGVQYSADHVPQPVDQYGRSKLAAEVAVQSICKANGMQYVCIRPPLVYGPGVGANFLRMMRLISLGFPLPFAAIDNRRSYVGVQNLVSFIEKCMSHPAAIGGTWLVCDNEDVSTPDLVRRLSRHLMCRSRLFSVPPVLLRAFGKLSGMQAEIERLCGSLQIDPRASMRSLDWRPPMSLDEGLALTAAAFISERATK